MTRFHVDLDQVATTVDDLDRCRDAFGELLVELQAHVRRLHDTWTGRAAVAHAQAQQTWEAGFAEMDDGLRLLREAARRAHESYGQAVTLNLELWR